VVSDCSVRGCSAVSWLSSDGGRGNSRNCECTLPRTPPLSHPKAVDLFQVGLERDPEDRRVIARGHDRRPRSIAQALILTQTRFQFPALVNDRYPPHRDISETSYASYVPVRKMRETSRYEENGRGEKYINKDLSPSLISLPITDILFRHIYSL